MFFLDDSLSVTSATTERRDLGLDDGSFWPVLEGIPATEMFKVIPQAPGHAYGMFMERFNELSELRKCA
ncbi:deoxyribonucleoside 5-monophosphate phosphatase [Escherichia coli]|nr:deoxyribonucleoside 5-monophosphate phosphatase [Escherichia coli]EHP5207113.1 deoxyribonucleoside 5-monophosphate phosphatase [Escherichia coli]EHU9106197.1 deoxyribonucleoside 5-monophosphate phosphatase [Escherichia coli]EHZ5663104.1 deoxyribonucleoside 5-monophosphate phosphatase [Escherichia coli]EIP7699758.1 deoxyribonucleoside 5-monophosphate phosphatase [Escherichia coli]